MPELIFEMITSTKSLKMLMNEYNYSYQEVSLLNPRLRNEGHIGELVYLYKKQSKSFDKNRITADINYLLLLHRLYIISYINSFNDIDIVENELINKVESFSKYYIKEKSILFNKNIISLLENIKSFTKEILNKSNNVSPIKTKIKDNISLFNNLLIENQYSCSPEKIKEKVETILLSIIKIINNNYYDSFNILIDI